jgi:hypothetical protein
LFRDYTPHEVKSAMSRMGGLMPMNIFLRQEIGRMQKVTNKDFKGKVS